MKYFLLLTNNFKYVLIAYFISILLASSLFCVLESHKFIDALYWAFVTSLTIGYGDLSPVTTYGKLVTILFGHFWIFLIIPAIISLIVTKLIQDQNEFTHAEQEQIKQLLLEINSKIKG